MPLLDPDSPDIFKEVIQEQWKPGPPLPQLTPQRGNLSLICTPAPAPHSSQLQDCDWSTVSYTDFLLVK